MKQMLTVQSKRLCIPLFYTFVILVVCHFYIQAYFVGPSAIAPNIIEPTTKFRIDLINRNSDETPIVQIPLNSDLNIKSDNNVTVENGSVTKKQRIRVQREMKTQNLKENSGCNNMSVKFAKPNTFKPRALVSFPGSGNTWLRHLIESSTGFYSGSIYRATNLIHNGFLGEGRPPNDGTTIVQKTHHSSVSSPRQNLTQLSDTLFGYRGILLVRNPFHAILSYWNYWSTGSQTSRAKNSSYSTNAWKTFVQKRAKTWGDLVEDWVTKSSDLHVVQYEELKGHTERELTRILQYLKQPINSTRIKCTVEHPKQAKEGSFHRQEEKTNGGVSPFKVLDTSGNFTLEVIVQDQIQRANLILLENNFPLQLKYKLIEK